MDGRTLVVLPAGFRAQGPPASLILVVLGLLACLWQTRRRADLVVVIWVPLIILAVIYDQVVQDIGVRYATPLLLFGCLAGGALWPVITAGGRVARRVGGWTVVGLLATSLAASIISFPGSLAWTDPLIGRPYQSAADSTVDWGQDFYAYRAWWMRHPDAWTDSFDFSLSLWELPAAKMLTSIPPAKVRGWVAVSTTNLNEDQSLYWLHAYCPVQIVDSTMVIYRFDRAPSALPGPNTPAAPCTNLKFSVRR